MNRRAFLKSTGAGALSLALSAGAAAQNNVRPNIVWIVVEDMSCHFSYQGETTISTPNVDRLAAEGVVFDRAYITCPVCSPSRSAMITGMYQTTIGAHNHRSFRGEIKHELPDPVRHPLENILRDVKRVVLMEKNLVGNCIDVSTIPPHQHGKSLLVSPRRLGRQVPVLQVASPVDGFDCLAQV